MDNIPEKTKMIVFGYIKQMDNQNKMNIPIDITNMILLFYFIAFNFYQEAYGQNLQFIDDKTVKMTARSWKSSTCLFGESVTKKMCNEYNVHIKIHSLKRLEIFIGYTTSFKGIKDWDRAAGRAKNDKDSVGIYIGGRNKTFLLCDRKNTYSDLKYKSESNFANGDTFVMSFNFINGDLILYHNNIIIVCYC